MQVTVLLFFSICLIWHKLMGLKYEFKVVFFWSCKNKHMPSYNVQTCWKWSFSVYINSVHKISDENKINIFTFIQQFWNLEIGNNISKTCSLTKTQYFLSNKLPQHCWTGLQFSFECYQFSLQFYFPSETHFKQY